MALSTYFKWNYTPFQTPNSSEMTLSTLFHEATPSPEEQLALLEHQNHVFPYSDNEFSSFFLPNPNSTLFDLDSYNFDPAATNFLYPPPHHDLLSCTDSSACYFDDPLISVSDILPIEEDHDYNPKRQKCCSDNQNQKQEQYSSSSFDDLVIPNNYLSDGFVPNPLNYYSPSAEELLLPAELVFSAVPEFKVPQLPQGTYEVINMNGDCEKKSGKENSNSNSISNGKTVSAQSIAARERRRKITEKTGELGKLVPGATKLNTAEMLHAAAKYVKFLQAQVSMLQLINNTPKEEDKAASPETEDMQALLVSPSVQEKLYAEEKCVVPKEFVITLSNHGIVQSRPSILKDLKLLIGTDTEKN